VRICTFEQGGESYTGVVAAASGTSVPAEREAKERTMVSARVRIFMDASVTLAG